MKKSNIRSGYASASGLYGQFYYPDSETPKYTGQLTDEALESKSQVLPPYLVYDVEKPVLKYHSLKSQLFTNAPPRKQ
jgi:hypothetical protein